MILYHGSYIRIEGIDLQKCKPYKDFGKGFYCTTIKKQAGFMAERVVKRQGGIKTVNVFELDEEIFKDKELTDQYSFHTYKALKYLKGV